MYSDVNTMATMESCGNDDQLKYNHNVFDLFSPHLTISSCAMGKQRLGPSLVCSQGMQVGAIKIVLLSRKTGSVSIDKRLLHFIFGDAQLFKFGYHAIRGRLPLTRAFIYGQIPHHQTSSVSPSIKNRSNMCHP